MAKFNVDSHLSNGQRLEWLALPEKGESAEQVEAAVRAAAVKKFGSYVFFSRWEHVIASNGFVVVRMYA